MENAKIQVKVVVCSGENGDGITFQRSTVFNDDSSKWLKETFREIERILGGANPGESKTADAAPAEPQQEARAQEQEPALKITAADSDPKDTRKTVEPNWRNEGVRGLLFLRCKSCKSLFHAFAKSPTTEWVCNCGEKIPLSKDTLAWFEYACDSCKRRIYGRTNVTDAAIEAGSLNCVCGAECPTMTWNPAVKMYRAGRLEA